MVEMIFAEMIETLYSPIDMLIAVKGETYALVLLIGLSAAVCLAIMAASWVAVGDYMRELSGLPPREPRRPFKATGYRVRSHRRPGGLTVAYRAVSGLLDEVVA